MNSYALSGTADADIEQIASDSIKQWGTERAQLYLLSLHQALQRLAEFPDMGRDASGIRPGYRRLEHASHVVFYRKTSSGVIICACPASAYAAGKSSLRRTCWQKIATRPPLLPSSLTVCLAATDARLAIPILPGLRSRDGARRGAAANPAGRLRSPRAMCRNAKSGRDDPVVATGPAQRIAGDQFAAKRGEVQPPQTHGHDQSATLPLLAST